jgi:hypothetical protein
MNLDDVVPRPQQRICHSRIVAAPRAVVWAELMDVTMAALPLSHALEGVRMLPAQLSGRNHRPLAGRTFLDVTPIPVLFTDRPRVVISAGLSQAWRLRGGLTPPALDAAALRDWSRPGWIKVAMEFRLADAPGGTGLERTGLERTGLERTGLERTGLESTVLTTETRVRATDPATRRAFAAYWFLIRPGSGAIRREVLRVVARRAESRSRPP